MAARSDSLTEHCEINEEIEVLKHIYIDELEVLQDENCKVEAVKVVLHPSTCEDTTVQYVCLTLVITIPNTYPHDVPVITIRNPRGLAEEEVKSIHDDIVQLAKDKRGEPMLFELIELAKEGLTEGNIPRCECCICLEHFHEGDVFTKTVCYHYFHGHCLGRYVKHSLSKHKEDKKNNTEVHCPVCRTSITYDLEQLYDAPPPIEDSPTFEISESIRKAQENMRELFVKQQQNGGIIDLEAEKNKFLINEGMVVSIPVDENVLENDMESNIIDDAKEHQTSSNKNKDSSKTRENNRDNKFYDARDRRGTSYRDKYYGKGEDSSERTSYRDKYYGKSEDSSERTSYRDKYYGKSEYNSERTSYRDKYYGKDEDTSGRTSYKDKYYGKDEDTSGRTSYRDKYYGKSEYNSERTSYRDKYYGKGEENSNRTGYRDNYYGKGEDNSERTSYRDKYYGKGEDNSERTSYRDKYYGNKSNNAKSYRDKNYEKDDRSNSNNYSQRTASRESVNSSIVDSESKSTVKDKPSDYNDSTARQPTMSAGATNPNSRPFPSRGRGRGRHKQVYSNKSPNDSNQSDKDSKIGLGHSTDRKNGATGSTSSSRGRGRGRGQRSKDDRNQNTRHFNNNDKTRSNIDVPKSSTVKSKLCDKPTSDINKAPSTDFKSRKDTATLSANSHIEDS